jgi:uncharacterized protein (DUF736 family)
MTTYETTTNIAIFKSKYNGNAKAPSYFGTITVRGDMLEKLRSSKAEEVELAIALWDRKSQQGNAYLSGKLEEPRKDKPVKTSAKATTTDEEDPF